MFVEKTLVANLRKWTLQSGGVDVPVGKIGISYPVVAWSLLEREQYDPNRRIGSQMTGAGGYGAGGYAGMPGGSGSGAGYLSSGESMGLAEGYAGADPAGIASPGYPGAGVPGAYPGMEGGPGAVGGQVPGAKGPKRRGDRKEEDAGEDTEEGWIDQVGDDDEMEPAQATRYRALAARLNYLDVDRLDIQYEVKEAATAMSSSYGKHWQQLSKIGK